MTCNHRWKLYTGLKEQFEYCEKCDIRKDKARTPSNRFGDGIIYGPAFMMPDNFDDTTEEIELPVGSGQQLNLDPFKYLNDVLKEQYGTQRIMRIPGIKDPG